MLRKILVFLISLNFFAALFFTVLAQDWVKMMEDPNANFYDIKKAFDEYWEGREIERGKGYKQFKRWEYFWEPRVYPTGNFPAPNQVSKAFLEYVNSNQRKQRLIDFSDWSPLGPTSWNTVSYNPGIGRINCSAMDPFNSNLIYVGAPSGGLWISTDGGNSWTTTTDALTVLGVTSIAIHPVNSNIIYIGTGDGDAGDTYSIGVLKSTDGGYTWSSTGLNWTVNQTRRISKLLIHPSSPEIILAATNSGVYKSTDAGGSWTLRQTGNFKDMEYKPGDPSTIYVCGTQFLRSTNGGNSFTGVSSGLPNSTSVNRLAIAVTPANQNYVYVLAGSNANSGFYGLYRSTDSGASFTLRSNSPNILGYAPDGSSSGGQSWYDLAIAASPSNADEIYSGGINIWKSINGGSTWTINAYWYYPEPSIPYVHADIHSMDFFGNTLFAGSDGGIFKTQDGGATWTDISAGMTTTQFYRIGGYPADENLLYGGTQDNGTNRYDGGSWTHVLGADGMECIVDYNNPNTVYASIQFGGLRKSFDGGNNFSDITSTITENGAWVTPYVINPFDSQVLYAGFSNVWKTTNGGSAWFTISSIGGNELQSLAIAPSNPDYIYTATYNLIYRTTDGGSSWTNITTGLPTGSAAITYISVSNNNPQKIWVTFSGYVNGIKIYESNDAGNIWTNISGSLPNLPANCVTQQGDTYNSLYIGMDVGVYYRNDAMSDWELFTSNLPNVIANELEIHHASGNIRLGSYGRGLWESPLAPTAATIAHTPLGDTEDITGPYPVTAEIEPGSSPLLPDSIRLNFSTDLSFSNSLVMIPTGSVNEYEASIPSQGANVTINYFISAVDSLGFYVSSPPNAPSEYNSFYAGTDTVAPVINHTPIIYADISELPLLVMAEITDNIEIDSVWIEYKINNQQYPAFGLLQGDSSNYSGLFPFDSSDVTIGDSIRYRIVARDGSSQSNQSVSGFHTFDIRKYLNFQQISNLVIPNNNPAGVSDVITIQGNNGFSIIDAKVVFKALHVNLGDLVVKLRSPSGTELTLMDRPGYPANPTGNPGDNPDLTLDDEASVSIEDVTFGSSDPAVGTFKPYPDSLNSYDGETISGDWTITVSDNFPAFTGWLTEWGLVLSVDEITAIDDNTSTTVPERFALYQNYPNPFNPGTTIEYSLPKTAKTNLTIYNVLGQKVRTLLNGEQNAGFKSVYWDGKNESGFNLGSGVYLYKLSADEFVQTRKMLLLK